MFSGRCMSCGVAIDRHRCLCAERCRETRSHRGEQNGFAKLTTQYVLAIRSETGTQVEIGKRYGIHHRLGARKIGADLSQSVLIADDRQVPHRGG